MTALAPGHPDLALCQPPTHQPLTVGHCGLRGYQACTKYDLARIIHSHVSGLAKTKENLDRRTYNDLSLLSLENHLSDAQHYK